MIAFLNADGNILNFTATKIENIDASKLSSSEK